MFCKFSHCSIWEDLFMSRSFESYKELVNKSILKLVKAKEREQDKIATAIIEDVYRCFDLTNVTTITITTNETSEE